LGEEDKFPMNSGDLVKIFDSMKEDIMKKVEDKLRKLVDFNRGMELLDEIKAKIEEDWNLLVSRNEETSVNRAEGAIRDLEGQYTIPLFSNVKEGVDYAFSFKSKFNSHAETYNDYVNGPAKCKIHKLL
jgi:hypothetical protein